jgi:hypothetical protein
MAHIQKTITYDMPDVYEGNTKAEGKTSTMPYDGPEQLILWVDKESGHIEQTWDKDDYTEEPIPLNIDVHTIDADTDENCVKIGMLFGGLATPKIYEVRVGPDGDKNSEVVDPSDLRRIYDENAVVENWQISPVPFKTDWRHLTDDQLRAIRNGRLSASDANLPSDMPADLRAEWEAYRQKLRDIPQDWAAVPNHFIKFPTAPDGEYAPEPENDDEVPVIMISERTAEDNDAIGQLTSYAGVED